MSTSSSVGTLLQERLDQLLRRVGKIEGDLRSPHDRDSQERAGELENDEVLEELDDMSRAEIRQIREGAEAPRERKLRHLRPLWSAHQRRALGGPSRDRHLRWLLRALMTSGRDARRTCDSSG